MNQVLQNIFKAPSLGGAFVVLLFLLFVTPAKVSAADSYDSMYVNTLNMSDEEASAAYGTNPDSVEVKPTMQELHEDSEPSYVMREYDHREQVIVGSIVMFCVALAMVMMNNYNPMR